MVVVVISSFLDSADDFPDQEYNAKAQDDPGDGEEYRVTDQSGRGRHRHWGATKVRINIFVSTVYQLTKNAHNC